jgi:hypothetical protein
MLLFTAGTKQELLDKIKGTKPETPSYGKPADKNTTGDAKTDCELWVCYELLQALAEKHLLKYPLTAYKSERPDFTLDMAGDKFGVETVNLVSEAWAALISTQKDVADGTIFDPDIFLRNPAKKSRKELKEIAHPTCPKLSEPGHEGDSIEREFTESLMQTINKKKSKYNPDEFRQYKSLWLVIYNNMYAGVQNEAFIPRISAKLDEIFKSCAFTKIYIQDTILFELSKNTVHAFQKIRTQS